MILSVTDTITGQFDSVIGDGQYELSYYADSVVLRYLAPSIPGDLNGDGMIGKTDVIILLGSWGPCDDCDNFLADLDGDCVVDGLDLIILLGNRGRRTGEVVLSPVGQSV